MATTQIVLGRGQDGQLYADRFDNATGQWVLTVLPGGDHALQFACASLGQRIDVYAVLSDLSTAHWFSSDGGQTWGGPDTPPGKWSSGLIALNLTP